MLFVVKTILLIVTFLLLEITATFADAVDADFLNTTPDLEFVYPVALFTVAALVSRAKKEHNNKAVINTNIVLIKALRNVT